MLVDPSIQRSICFFVVLIIAASYGRSGSSVPTQRIKRPAALVSYLLGKSNNLEPMNVLYFWAEKPSQNKAQTPSNQNNKGHLASNLWQILTDLPRIIHFLGWENNDPFFGDDIFRDGDLTRSFFKDL